MKCPKCGKDSVRVYGTSDFGHYRNAFGECLSCFAVFALSGRVGKRRGKGVVRFVRGYGKTP